MKRMNNFLLTISLLAIVAGCGQTSAVTAAVSEAQVTAIISQMPAKDTQQLEKLSAELAALNPQATAIMTETLKPVTDPADDNAARYGLSALTHYTSRNEAKRKVYAEALVKALPTLNDKQNQGFVITQLQRIGKQEAVAPLAAFLNDDVLCGYATRALLTIGGSNAEATFLKAFDKANDTNKVTLIKALGEIQSKSAAKKIAPYADSSDRATRDVALYALANIGDPASQKVLNKASRTKDTYQRGQYTALYLTYAQRLAENGDVTRCAKICTRLAQRKGDAPNVRLAAIETLAKAVGGNLNAVTDTELRAKVKTLIAEAAPQAPAGFVSLFNGKDLTGWKGLLAKPYDNPIKRAALTPEQLAVEQKKADALMRKHWKVVDGVLEFDGDGFSLATIKNYEDFEMLVDWKIINPRGDSGIYLRGTPQVQIWDPDQHKTGSGGLYNNKKNPSKPSMIADNPIGEWNTFRIKMIGEKVTVHLNGKLIVDNVTLENYWDRNRPIFPSEQIELQCHGDPIHFKNIFIREIKKDKPINTLTAQEKADGFVQLFNGKDLTGWVGSTDSYGVKDGVLFCRKGTGRNIYTEKEYDNFVMRFDFKLDPGTNNGLGIRTPTTGDAAYVGMELQILDNTAQKYSNLHDWQYHGSVYGIIAADPTLRTSAFKPVGEWNTEEVIANGDHIIVKVNGKTIVDGNIREKSVNGTETLSGKKHPGLFNKKGHIGFLGHGDYVEYRNLRIKQL